MNKKLDIAAILNDMPKGTKLWSPAFGNVTLDAILGDKTYCIQVKDADNSYYKLTEYGQLSLKGECILFPSKTMQDWSKFAWKKGDVLKSIVGNNCIFNCWSNEDYTEFYAEFLTTNGDERYAKHVPRYTIQWYKEDNKQYIHEIEKHYGGKLNLSTLEIEKPNFKDGDIVLFYDGRGCFDAIAIIKEQGEPTSMVYTFLEIPIMKLYYQTDKFYQYTRKARFATDSEEQQLFAALAKEGKAWDAEKKQIVDLPKKCRLKPKDWCLMRFRSTSKDVWRLCQFGFFDDKDKTDNYCAIGGNWFDECLPYNDQTAHLLGTTDDYEEGGEE